MLAELKRRLRVSLSALTDDPDDLVELLRPSQNPKFGDYQANCAMPLGKRLDTPPRQVAEQIAERLDIEDMCHPPEIAGPGFINIRLKEPWLAERLADAVADERLTVPRADPPRTYVIDYSSPNLAKPMHVGHIRSTVIGDALYRTLTFLGHKVIGDNHLGDWGTQFGMILYGYRHFVDEAAYAERRVEELARLYKLVITLIEYHDGKAELPELERQVARQQQAAERQQAAAPSDKKAAKALRKSEADLRELRGKLAGLKAKQDAVNADPKLSDMAAEHPDIARAVLEETSRLHAGDTERVGLWKEFLPKCRQEIERIYKRLDITFDYEHGESFYHDRLESVVQDLETKRLARESDEATCVFLDGFETPMIVRKRDGAFLYATTDLATIQYRTETWQPDAILYVVDHRQSEHFAKLFATARLWGCRDVQLTHISFGTVLGDDGRPYRTRSGKTVGLEGLLDEAVRRAHDVVSAGDDAKPTGAELSESQRKRIAEVVGIAALKYADLSHNRTSDYVFSYDKMLALNGNTATYMQYAYARVRNIFARGGVDVAALRSSRPVISLAHEAERALALQILRFSEALELTVADYRPNQLTSYLFELADCFSTFYEKCPVLKAGNDAERDSRLLLCDLTARTLKQGLALLGIDVIEKM